MKYPIVVGTDLTEASNDALIQAATRASRGGLALTVVHAQSPLLWGAENEVDDLDRLRKRLERQVTSLTGRSQDEYSAVVERGMPHAVLARLAVSLHALLVVGSHMRHGVGQALPREVPERVVERVRGPVLVTRPRTGSEHVLVAVDWSFNTSVALDSAIDEARSSDSKLSVFHCINTSSRPGRPVGERSQVVEARQALRAALQLRHVNPAFYVVEGETQSLLPQFAARTDADLIIIGTPCRSMSALGTTTSMLRHAPCSVLFVDEGSVLPLVGSTLQASPN